jgi:E3 ubiquitin-protein ligase RAD18
MASNQPQVSKQDDDRIEEDELVILEPPPLVIKSGIHCPICQRPFKTVEQVDSHIDTCTGPQPTSSQQTYNLRPPKLVVAAPSPSNRIATTPLPKLNYAMYNETKLRAILAEQGLSTIGNKSILSARHKEFVNLHNANLDRRNPQSRHEILKQLENWDITQQSLPLKRKQELDGLEWGRKFEESYADLTKTARESVAKRRKVVGEDTIEDTSVKSSSQEERVA